MFLTGQDIVGDKLMEVHVFGPVTCDATSVGLVWGNHFGFRSIAVTFDVGAPASRRPQP